jgi:hypothetical protein
MTKKYVSAPAKLMKSVKSKPKSEFHSALTNINNIINSIQYEKDKKKIDNSYKKKFNNKAQLVSDTYLLNKIYSKPRKFFRITDVSPEKDKDSKNLAGSSNKQNVITVTNNSKNNTYKRRVFTIIDVPTGAKTGALHPTYSIKK